jgi:hypothetical protein
VTQPDRSDALGVRAVLVWAFGAAALLVALALWQRNGYWEYSDGVYALTARLFLHGGDLYGEIAAAQPPPIFLFGAGALAIGDSAGFLRAAVAAVQLATSGLVLVAVWRLTRSRPGAVVAALVLLLAPWTLREHAQLIPETFAAPLLLGAALAAGRASGGGDGAGAAGRAALLAGVLAALATAFKLAFVLPAILVMVVGVRGRSARVRGLAAFVGTGAVLGLASLAVFGEPLLDGAVRAQRETGLAGLSYVGGLWAQAGWNLLPLLACAALAWPLRRRLADAALARSLAAAAIGGLLLLTTLFKSGSYLTVVVAIEPPLVCLGAAGVVAAWREWRQGAAGDRELGAGGAAEEGAAAGRREAGSGQKTAAGGAADDGAAAGRRAAGGAAGWSAGAAPWALGLAAAAILLGVVQVGSLLVAPSDPAVFTRPSADSGPGWDLSPDAVDAEVARMRACPPGVAASGPPYLAFVAERRIAGDQPDQFIVQHAPVYAAQRAVIDADRPLCP